MRWFSLFSLLICASAAAQTPTTLTLDDAIRIAKKRHPNVRVQEAQLTATLARRSQALSAFLPSVTASFAYNPQTANFALSPGFKRLLERPSTSGIATATDSAGRPITVQCVPPIGKDGQPDNSVCAQAPPQPSLPASYQLFNYWTASLGLQITLFDFGRSYYGHRAATRAVDAQKLTVTTTQADVVLNVKVAYYGALASQAAVGVAEEEVTTQRQHLEQARTFYEVGTKTKIDVASAESNLAGAQLTLARARGALTEAQATLAAAIGDEVWRDYQLVTPAAPSEGPIPTEEQAISEALHQRLELRDYALRGRSLDDSARSLRGSYFPSLLLAAGPSFAGTDLGGMATNFAITVQLSYPLGVGMNPWLVRGQVKEAEANRATLDAQAAGERNQIRLEAAQAQAQLAAAREAVVAAESLVTAAREQRDLAAGRYQAGAGSIIELSDAELNFVNARFQEVQARLDLATADARLDHALGQS